MRPYKQLSEDERRVIQKMTYSGVKKEKIAEALDRDISTIYREIGRNKSHGYNATEAQAKSRERRYIKKGKVNTDGFLKMLIVDLSA